MAATTGTTLSSIVELAWWGILMGIGFLIGWAFFSGIYKNREYRVVQAAKQQARIEAWIEFQQTQGRTPMPPSSSTPS